MPERDVNSPDAPAAYDLAGKVGHSPAFSSRLQTLKGRPDFLRAARACRASMPGFLLQARERGGDEPQHVIRVGFTCSGKLGNAVVRNRAKRRLREVVRMVLPGHGRPGWDYVLVGRPGKTATRPFDRLLADLRAALRQVHDL